MNNDEDKVLIKDYLNGDEKSLNLLINKYLKSAYNFSYYLCKDEKIAEDVVQDSFLKVWKNLKKYNNNSNFKVWFFAILRNTTFDYLRKNKEILISEFDLNEGNALDNSLMDDSILADEVFDKDVDSKIMRKIIEDLPFIYKEVILLHYFEYLNLEQISVILDRPLNTIKSQHKRALEKIKEKMN